MGQAFDARNRTAAIVSGQLAATSHRPRRGLVVTLVPKPLTDAFRGVSYIERSSSADATPAILRALPETTRLRGVFIQTG